MKTLSMITWTGKAWTVTTNTEQLSYTPDGGFFWRPRFKSGSDQYYGQSDFTVQDMVALFELYPDVLKGAAKRGRSVS